jgi:hypothetical protein
MLTGDLISPRGHCMKAGNSPMPVANLLYRCAGPNCGTLKAATDRWWLMWTSFLEFNRPVLYLCPWDDEIAVREGTLHVCGELCAQRLQSQFMGNVTENQRSAST